MNKIVRFIAWLECVVAITEMLAKNYPTAACFWGAACFFWLLSVEEEKE